MYVYVVFLPYAVSGESMPRTLTDVRLDSRAARARLAQRPEPHWRSMSDGLAIGYRRGLKGGTWVARHYAADTGRRFESLGTADDVVDAGGDTVLNFNQAQAAARKWFAALANPVLAPLTVRQCLADYLAYTQTYKKGALIVRSQMNAHILPKLGDLFCDKLTKDQIESWLHALATAPAKSRGGNYRPFDNSDPEAIRRRQSSANRCLTTLKAALNRAWADEKLASDAAWRRVKPFEGVDAARVGHLAVTEAQRLINACQPDFRKLVQAALVSGARYGELCRMTVADFNPDAGTVHVRTSKNRKSRHIVLTAEGVALFKSLAAGKSGAALLLTRANGAPWKTSDQFRPMGTACAAAKIVPAIGIHGLRHTWCSLSVMNGVPLMVVAKNLGHTDSKMIEKHYGHLAPSFITDAIRAGAPQFGIVADSKVVAIR
jgi:integrase